MLCTVMLAVSTVMYNYEVSKTVMYVCDASIATDLYICNASSKSVLHTVILAKRVTCIPEWCGC